jgi:hypothetical protein
MQKVIMKPSMDPSAAARLEAAAERLGMTGAALSAAILHEFSHVRPDAIFKALAAVPDDLKTRPVGRPVGSKTKRTATAASAPAEAVVA